MGDDADGLSQSPESRLQFGDNPKILAFTESSPPWPRLQGLLVLIAGPDRMAPPLQRWRCLQEASSKATDIRDDGQPPQRCPYERGAWNGDAEYRYEEGFRLISGGP